MSLTSTSISRTTIVRAEGTFALSALIEESLDRNHALFNFLMLGKLQSGITFSKYYSAPPFVKILSYKQFLDDFSGQALLDRFRSCRALSFLFEEKSIDFGSSTCCGAKLVKALSEVSSNQREYYLLAEGILNPSLESLTSLKQGQLYFPERGLFSVHESHLSLILEDLSKGELVYPVLDLVSCSLSDSRSLQYSYIIDRQRTNFPHPITLDRVGFCPKCGNVYFLDAMEHVGNSPAEPMDPQEKRLLSILGVEDINLASLERIDDAERLAFLRICIEVLDAPGDMVLSGLLRSLSTMYRKKLMSLLDYLKCEQGSINVADSALLVSRKYRGTYYVGLQSYNLKAIKKMSCSGLSFVSGFSYSASREEEEDAYDLVLGLEDLGGRQRRIRPDTSFGTYIGIIQVLRKLYLMHPIAKSLGITNSDLAASSTRFSCEHCHGKWETCKFCYQTGLSSYLDEIEIQGVNFRRLLSLSLNDINSKFNFVRDVNKISKTYLGLGLGNLALNDLLRGRRVEEFALAYLAREGLPILRKGGKVLIKGLFFDFEISHLASIKKYLSQQLREGGGEILVVDHSILVQFVFSS